MDRSRALRLAKSSDDCPARPPDHRSVDGQGRIRLRWRIRSGEWVEALEHRWMMGFPDGRVIHLNGDQQDNRPANLEVRP